MDLDLVLETADLKNVPLLKEIINKKFYLTVKCETVVVLSCCLIETMAYFIPTA